MASLRPYINLHIFGIIFVFYFPNHKKLLLSHNVINSWIFRFGWHTAIILANLGGYRCTWYSCLGFEAWKNYYYSSCAHEERYGKIGTDSFDWFMQIKEDISLNIPGRIAGFQKRLRLYPMSSWYTLICMVWLHYRHYFNIIPSFIIFIHFAYYS